MLPAPSLTGRGAESEHIKILGRAVGFHSQARGDCVPWQISAARHDLRRRPKSLEDGNAELRKLMAVSSTSTSLLAATLL